MPAHTIAEVIVQLDQIIAQTEHDNNPLGYFAALTATLRYGCKRGSPGKSLRTMPAWNGWM